MRYYFLGLGGGSSAVSGNNGASKELYGSIGLERLQPLDHLMGLARAGRERRAIDVLKIDCEGCEWQAFNDGETDGSSRIRAVFAHRTAHDAALRTLRRQLNVLMGHPLTGMDSGCSASHAESGLPVGAKRDVASSGLDPVACCIELHFARPGLTNAFASHAAGGMEPAYKAVQAKQAAVPRKSGSRSAPAPVTQSECAGVGLTRLESLISCSPTLTHEPSG